jgi:Tfp pilus assembly protein PilO
MRNEFIQKLKSEWPSAVLISVSLLLSAALLKFAAVPAWFDYLELSTEIQSTSAMVKGENGRSELKSIIEDKRKLLENKSGEIRQRFGKAENLPQLLQIIFDRAVLAGVTIERAQPQNESENSKSGGYEIVLEVSGQYKNLAGFVSYLEQMPLITRVDRLSVDRGQAGGLSMNLLLKSFLKQETVHD